MGQREPHGWLCSETLVTRSGDFEFVNGYPAIDTANRLRELQVLNRATEVYLTQLMPVSEMALRQGLRAFGASKPTQVVVWEQLMDAKTVLLTANTETVYAVSHLALKGDGPTVIEAPPHMLGFIQDGLQRYLAEAVADVSCSSLGQSWSMETREYAPGRLVDLFGDPAQRTVLLWHGTQADARSVIRPLAELVASHGLGVVVPDWNSHADDGGRADLLRSVHFSRKRTGDSEGLVVVGWSLGGVAAAGLTIHARYFGVRLAHTVCLAGAFMARDPISGKDLETELPGGGDQSSFTLLHGVADDVVPVEASRAFATTLERNKWPVEVVELAADHGSIGGATYDPELTATPLRRTLRHSLSQPTWRLGSLPWSDGGNSRRQWAGAKRTRNVDGQYLPVSRNSPAPAYAMPFSTWALTRWAPSALSVICSGEGFRGLVGPWR